MRYNQIEAELESRTESWENFSEGVRRFIYGLGKKILLANFLAQIADNVFDYIPNPSVLIAWLGAVSYTFQIYFDFSGYSDMAIGLGLMFGFHFKENFNYPYIARSISDFWRRWHISLSKWFRDYVYIPLGGNRVSHSRWLLNVFIVWLLTGIWHGANWTFILWGLAYFVLLALEREVGLKLGYAGTMIAVILLWVLFRCESVTQGMSYLACMFGLKGNAFADEAFMFFVDGTWILMVLAVLGVFPFAAERLKKYPVIESVWLLAVFGLSACEIVNSGYNPFIYFNF